MGAFDIVLSIFIGIGLAAATGFRVFLPLLVLSLAAFYDIIPLNESWEWAGSITAVITLSAATIVETFGYYIPFVDNALDFIAIPLATVAGTAVVIATIGDLNPIFTYTLAIIAGGGTAAAIGSGTSAVRLASTGTTAGIANPVVSTAETGASIIMAALSIFIPILGFLLVLVLFFFTIRYFLKRKRRRRLHMNS